MDTRQNLSFLDILAIVSSVLQIADYSMDVKQISNDKLFEELQKQNKEYLQKILENQEKIIKLLSEKSDFR